MALIDYKIVRLSHAGRRVTVDIRINRGAVTTEQEEVGRVLQDVTRYRRIAVVRTLRRTYDVRRDMTLHEFYRHARALLNARLLAWATANGHTVITEQQDSSELEPVDNETET